MRKAILGLLACFVLLAMIPVGGFLYLEHRLSGNLTRIPGAFAGLDRRPSKPAGRAEEAVNILVLVTDRGSDVTTTGVAARATTWLRGAQQSDSVMILHIAADRRAASSISIPLDTWVEVPGYGMNTIDAAFSFAGPSLAIATVEDLTSVRIDHLAVIDWSGFEALVDAVGGIDVTVPETATDPVRALTWTPGVHHVDGMQALGYIGRRYEPPREDLARLARQQVVLRTLMQNVLHQEMRKDPRMLFGFLDTVTKQLSVDDEWSTTDMAELVLAMRNFRSANLTYLTMPVAGFGTEGGQSVVYADRATASDLWGAVIADEVEDWSAQHPGRLTPDVVR